MVMVMVMIVIVKTHPHPELITGNDDVPRKSLEKIPNPEAGIEGRLASWRRGTLELAAAMV